MEPLRLSMEARWLSKDARSFRLRPARFPLRVFLTCGTHMVASDQTTVLSYHKACTRPYTSAGWEHLRACPSRGCTETGLPEKSPKNRLGWPKLMQSSMPEVLTTPEASMPAASARPPASGGGLPVALVIATCTRR